jgi:hypothetical protein
MDASRFDRLVQVVGGSSRRSALRAALSGATVAAAGLLVSATGNDAKTKKRKKKPKPPPPPLAFAVATVLDVALVSSGPEPKFECQFEYAMVYPAGPFGLTGNGSTVQVVATATAQQMRAAIVAEVRNFTVHDLFLQGFDVPADRIAVTLL